MNYLIAIIVVLAVALLLGCYYNYHIVHRMQEEHEQEIATLQQELNRLLEKNGNGVYYTERQLLISTIKADLEQQVAAVSSFKQQEELRSKFYDELFAFHKKDGFQTYVDLHLHGFYAQLHAHCVQLSDKELQICSLMVLDVPNHDIMLLMGYSASSLPNTRYRIVKKLGLGSAVKLYPFLLEFYGKCCSVE